MNKDLRIEQLDNIKKSGKPYSKMEVFYKNDRHKMDVFEIDLELLIYNKYNGRISSMVKSYEKQFEELNPEQDNHKKKIEEFLWNSSLNYNKNTETDINEKGQLKYGIVTKDGIIIDGNRRALILNKIAKEKNIRPQYFKAAILDETLDDNPKEIMRLETMYQMGEDAKVDYNPIEKYLKCKDLKEIDFTKEQIAKMMGDKPSNVHDYLAIMKLMDDYLDKLTYSGIYTRLEKTEGIFVDLENYLSSYGYIYNETNNEFQYKNTGNGLSKMNWNPQETDINELKLIYYDFIRARYSGEGKEYRIIGKPNKEDSIFCNKSIWDEFKENHFKKTDNILASEPTIDEIRKDNPKGDLAKLLKSRDEKWTSDVSGLLKGNLNIASDKLANVKSIKEPKKLLQKALDALLQINTDIEAFYLDNEVEALIKEINSLTWDFKQVIKHNKQN
ncbi:MAG: hypothetical protein J0M37_02870 [Ignavibacteria bacterium]|nr:hypothetical protein [Ignavibacteria bacterium]